MSESIKKKTLKGTIWSTIERLSVQTVGFIVMILMARVISPTDYSLVGMIMVFIDISQSLVDGGFSQALIRKRDRIEVDNSTVFYFNVVVGFVLYFLLYAIAPLIARFYEQPSLIEIIRVISIIVVCNSFVVVQRAILTINIDFKTQARASFIATVFGGVIGVVMAYTGFGVWAIVIYQLVNVFFNVVLLWWFSAWRPVWAYSWDSFRDLFGFGSKLALSGIINTLYNNLFLLVIGKFFRPADLGYYSRAHQFGAFLSSNVTGILQRVTYPVLCSIQDDEVRLAEAYRKFIRLSAFVVFPCMLGLAALSKPLIVMLLTDKWLFSAKILQILCLSMMWFPVHAINLNILQVKGRSDLFLRLEIIKKLIGISIVVITIPYGLIAMCWGQVINSYIALVLNCFYTEKLIGFGLLRQLKDLMPSLGYSFSMACVVYFVTCAINSDLLKLIIGFIVGVIWYFGVAYLTRSRDLKFLLTLKR